MTVKLEREFAHYKVDLIFQNCNGFIDRIEHILVYDIAKNYFQWSLQENRNRNK